VARVDRERQVREVGLTEDQGNDRRDDVAHECRDHGRERDTDHDRDSKVKHVAPQQESLEVLEHLPRSPIRGMGWRRYSAALGLLLRNV
jgi:hypothetical protein